MAGGFAKDGNVQEQIDATVDDAIARVRNKMPQGESRRRCQSCDAEIPEARRNAMPGVRLCVPCQAEQDEEEKSFALFNRRGSKDSQLR